ncbi:MAG: type III pantothenate kinase [Burkholderiales bacterium]|nr:type III pantothenate kinase [Burkholderiales bacterium]
MKWGLHEDAGFVVQGWLATDDVQRLDTQWNSVVALDSVVIANVAGEKVGTWLKRACERWQLQPVWAEGQRQQCGVSNTYDDPKQLGPDRWAALIGARALLPANCVVVCMGTATTIDALTEDGTFLGGIILPGVDMMHASLANQTARLGTGRGGVVRFPRSTRDAITTGAVRATCGAIEYLRNMMQQAGYDNVAVVATGGAAQVFSSACGYPIVLNETLVLKGLVLIGEEAMRQLGA